MTAVEDQGGKAIGGTYETIIKIKIRNKCNVYLRYQLKSLCPFSTWLHNLFYTHTDTHTDAHTHTLTHHTHTHTPYIIEYHTAIKKMR